MGKQQKGFTLVEMIVVITVIAILFVTAIVAFRGFRQAALDESVATDANRLKAHYDLYQTIFPNGTSFTSAMTAHSFCPMCPEAGLPGTLNHKPECAGVEITIEWNSAQTNIAGQTAWQIAGLP